MVRGPDAHRFDTPAHLETALAQAGFVDIHVSTEETDFVYADEHEWWSSLWSHGIRQRLERLRPQVAAAHPLWLCRFIQYKIARQCALSEIRLKKVIWGVISTAKIGRDRVLPGMLKSGLLEIRAIASRDEARAAKTAAALGIPKSYGSYEALLADPEIEAIYNPLPNHLHVPLTLQAAAAGKHVLCEKPIALTALEATQLRAAAGKVLIAEAFMVRFHPQWLRARELVRSGRIGTLRAVQMFFGYNNVDPNNVRNKADIGGGGLYDIGCYAVVAGRFFLEAEPIRGIALVDRCPTFSTDRMTSALVDFGDGRRLDFTVSTQIAPHQRIQLCGTRGRIEIPIPVNAPQGAATRIFIDDCSSLEGTGIVTETLPPSDQYMLQGEAFSRAVRGEVPLEYGIEDAVANMHVIDALFRSETSGTWESIAPA